MLRALLLGGVLAVSVSACGKSETQTSAKVAPGVAAGKVLEVKGAVTFKRGDATQPLTAGATVEGADVVITGADGNVVIELAHNSARWELGPNKQQKVSESIAWKAQKATAEEIDQATAAAGRPAERNAAGTVAMADDADGAAAEPPAEEAKAAPARDEAARAEPDMIAKGGGAATPPPRRRPSAPARSQRAAAAPAPAPPPPPPPADVEPDEDAPRRTRGATKKEAPPMAPQTASAETARAPASPPAPGGVAAGGSVGVTGGAMARPSNTPAGLVAAKATLLHKCMVDNAAKEDVTLVVNVVLGEAETVKLSAKSAVSAGLERCVKAVIRGITFTGTAKVTRVLKP